MDIAPQRHLRRVTLLYVSCVAAVLVCGALCLSEATQQHMRYHYNLMFIHNSGAVTAMLRWLPTRDALDTIDLDSLVQRTSFDVSVVRAHDDAGKVPPSLAGAVAHGVEYTMAFPGTVATYIPDTDTVLRVRELTPTYGVLGQQALVTAISLAFVLITIAVAHIGLHAAQCLAAVAMDHAAEAADDDDQKKTKGGRRAGCVWLHYAAFAVAALTLVSPLAVCAVHLVVVTRVLREMFVQTWMGELGRAVVLQTELYDAIARMYVSSSPVGLLSATLVDLNDHYIGAHAKYAAVLYNASSQTLLPQETVARLLTADELAALTRYFRDGGEGGGARGNRVTARLPNTDIVIATAPLTQLDGCGLLLVRRLQRSLPQLLDDATRSPSLLMLGGIAVLAAVALLCFPYTTLGAVGGRIAWQGPWAWRTSAYWPLQKLLHAMMLLVLLICAVALLASKLCEYYGNRDDMQRTLRDQLSVSNAAADAGERLLDNYVGLYTHNGWNTTALRRYLPDLNSTTLSDISRFYQGVFMLQATLHVSQGSVFYALLTVKEAALPLLDNDDAFNAFVDENMYQHDVKALTVGASLWDVRFLLACLLPNATVLRHGDVDVMNDVLTTAVSLAGSNGFSRVNASFTRVLRAAAAYADLAETYEKQKVTWLNLSTLYAQPMGRQVVEYEDKAFSNANVKLDEDTFYINSYNVNLTTLLGPVLAALLLLGADLGVDLVVVARVFARSRATRRRRRRCHGRASTAVASGGGGSNGSSGDGHIHNNSNNKNNNNSNSGNNLTAGKMTTTAAAAAAAAMTTCASATAAAAVPSNDFTAPSLHLRIHHRELRAAVRSGLLATAALTVICAAVFVFCEREAHRLMLPMTQQDTYVDSMMHTLHQNMQAMAITSYAAAAWLRALVSRHPDDFVTAAQVTYNLSRLKSVKWLDAYEQQRSVNEYTRLHAGEPGLSASSSSSLLLATTPQQAGVMDAVADDKDDNKGDGDVVRVQGSSSSSGNDGNSSDVNADVASLLQNFTTYASTTLDAGVLDIYSEFAHELQTAMTLVNLDALRTCMSPDNIVTVMNTLRSYMFALIYNKPARKFDGVYAALQPFVSDTQPCMVPTSALQHMRYTAALMRRIVYDIDVMVMAKELQARALRSAAKRASTVQQEMDATSTQSNRVDTTTMAWAAIVLTWLCTPLVYAIYRAATRAHEALYYS